VVEGFLSIGLARLGLIPEWPNPHLHPKFIMAIPDGIGETDSIVNLQEQFGKVVGRLRPVTPQRRYEQLLRLKQSVAGSLTPFPRGVYRFKSFEEANAWETKHIMRRAAELHHETQASKM
jgi:hypothetical protein